VDELLWKRIGDLFEAARQLDGEARSEFLREQCGDDHSLHDELVSLLNANGERGPLDSRPTVTLLPVPDVVAGRFRIVRYVGEGGMGTVYEAEDLQLHDRVALKNIHPDIAIDSNAVERFKREILLGKSVTHPNVCRVHDLVVDRSETGAEVLYLSMQYLGGETLASRIRRGPIPTAEAFPLVQDMADGLSAAHLAGVIHRDFKSGNVMLVPRPDRLHAVITDFGLARPVRDHDLHSFGRLAGTIEYMPPEQIRGEHLTPAADIYAFGVVMYEMVTGQRPFNGSSKWAIADQHLHDEPKPPRDLVPNLDVSWNDAIVRCLNKDAKERFQSAEEVKAAQIEPSSRTNRFYRSAKRTMSGHLVALSIVSSVVVLGLGAIPSVRHRVEEWLHIGPAPYVGQLAVLPMMVPTDDTQSAALEYGLADTLATRLTKVTGTRPLQIVPASEIRAKGVTSLEQAQQEFGVNFGLELTLRRSGDMVRVNYQLVDAKTHREVKGDTITAPISDGFAIEDRVADSVVRALDLELQPQERQILAEHGTQEPAAYDYYLEGRGYLQEYQKPENVESAITVFQHALEKDPQYALAYAGLGESYWRKYELSHDKQWADQAQKSCNKAVALDLKSDATHVCLGLVYEGTGRYEDAVTQYKLAMDREPANDDAIRGLAEAYQHLGKANDAETTYKAAIRARPNYWESYNALGVFYFGQGRYSEAAETFTQVTNLAPDSFQGYSNLGGSYVALGRNSDAIATLEHSIKIRRTYSGYSNLGTAQFRLRQYGDAANSYAAALAISDQDYMVWGNLADALYYAGKRDQWQSATEKAISLAKSQLEVNPRDATVLGDLATYYSALDKHEEALTYLTKALELSEYKSPDILFEAAIVYNDCGQPQRSLDWLQKALAAGFSPASAANAPALEKLHSSPRFQAMVKAAKADRN
jgi:serine/threonine-protein kinase